MEEFASRQECWHVGAKRLFWRESGGWRQGNQLEVTRGEAMKATLGQLMMDPTKGEQELSFEQWQRQEYKVESHDNREVQKR